MLTLSLSHTNTDTHTHTHTHTHYKVNIMQLLYVLYGVEGGGNVKWTTSLRNTCTHTITYTHIPTHALSLAHVQQYLNHQTSHHYVCNSDSALCKPHVMKHITNESSQASHHRHHNITIQAVRGRVSRLRSHQKCLMCCVFLVQNILQAALHY